MEHLLCISYEVVIIFFFAFFDDVWRYWNLIRRNAARHNVLEDLDTDGNKQNLALLNLKKRATWAQDTSSTFTDG